MPSSDYNKYLTDLNQYNTDRDFYYGQRRDEMNDQTNDCGTLGDIAQL